VGLVDEALAGSVRALARLATHIENDDELAIKCLDRLYPLTGRARTVGVTGPPGVGKSTLVNALVRTIRANGETCAVVAVDPSSPFSGGAALGDRIRMLEHHGDRGVFVRSTASRGRTGGLAPATSGLMHLFDAVGYDVVIVETVGIGQEEIDIVELAETVVLVQTPGFGDTVQSLKAGVLEIADMFVVNKADVPGAHAVAKELKAMIALGTSEPGWIPPVLTVVSTKGEGMDALATSIRDHAAWLRTSDELSERRAIFATRELSRQLHRLFEVRLHSTIASDQARIVVRDVAERRLSPQRGAAKLLETLSIKD
jgi:LAO/AO transport system kinase